MEHSGLPARTRSMVTVVACVALLLGAAGLPTARGVGLPTATRAVTGVGSAAQVLRDPITSTTFVVPVVPTKSQKVMVDVATRVVGRAQYVARLSVARKGVVRVQFLRVGPLGVAKKVGKSKVLMRGLRAKAPYVLRTTTVTEPTRVVLTARVWRAGSTPTGPTLLRRDYSAQRLLAAGEVRGSSWGTRRAAPASVKVTVQAPPPPPQRKVGAAGTAASVPGLKLPPATLKSVLPSTRALGGGQRVYVSPEGEDSATGTLDDPVRTLPRALDLVSAGGQVVLRGGTYPISTNSALIDRTKTGVIVTNHPGEVPLLDGTRAVAGAARSEGSGIVSFEYQQVPAAPGEGYDLNWLPAAQFDSAGRPVGLAATIGWECVASDGRSHSLPAPSGSDPDGCPSTRKARVISAYYPDQVWVAGTRLTQVLTRARVRAGHFFVQRGADAAATSTRVYLSSQDVARGEVRVSTPAPANLLRVDAAKVTLNGLHIRGFSGAWNLYPIHAFSIAHGLRIRNTVVEDASAVAIRLSGTAEAGGGGILRDVVLDGVRLKGPGMKGLSATYTTGLLIAGAEVDGTNRAGEWALASGLHITRTHNTVVRASVVKNGNARGIWFDQSSYNTRLIGNRVERNGAEQVFYEFSHALTMIGNLLVGGSREAALRLSGASDTKLANNTILGGRDSIWVYVDPRSKSYFDSVHNQTRWCSEHRVRYGRSGDPKKDCNVAFASDYDTARSGAYGTRNETPGLSWRVSLTTMVNNIVGPSSASGHCSAVVPVCMSGWTKHPAGVTTLPMNEILPARAVVDGNVYQSKGQLFQVWSGPDRPGAMQASSLLGLQSTLGGGYYRMTRPEWHGQSGSGWTDSGGKGTAALAAKHPWAVPSPADSRLVADLPAGSRHYGAFWG